MDKYVDKSQILANRPKKHIKKAITHIGSKITSNECHLCRRISDCGGCRFMFIPPCEGFVGNA